MNLKNLNLNTINDFMTFFNKSYNAHNAINDSEYSEEIIMLKNGSKIHIKKKNRGKFTESAKRAGQSVQEHAKSVLNDPNATPLQRKRANFARNSKKWKHAKGGPLKFTSVLDSNPNFDNMKNDYVTPEKRKLVKKKKYVK